MFDPATAPDGVYAILFTSKTCPVCPRAKARFSSARQGRAGVFFMEEDVLRSPSLASRCQVHHVPSVRVLHIVDGLLQRVEDPLTWEPGDTDGVASADVMKSLKEAVDER